jgi:hypothetical protein
MNTAHPHPAASAAARHPGPVYRVSGGGPLHDTGPVDGVLLHGALLRDLEGWEEDEAAGTLSRTYADGVQCVYKRVGVQHGVRYYRFQACHPPQEVPF